MSDDNELEKPMQTRRYLVEMSDDAGGDDTQEFEADDEDAAFAEARRICRDWVQGGDWGDDGASVSVYYTLHDAAEYEESGDEDDYEPLGDGHLTVDIEPNHAAMIRAACGERWDGRWGRCCGWSPDDHDWTSEGEGGLDSNPGVWAVGGTAMEFASHCRDCGLRRHEHSCGSQRNPGERDSVSYEMPEDWCEECQSEECRCERHECVACGRSGRVAEDEMDPGLDEVALDTAGYVERGAWVCGECLDGGEE